jgi:hypothetical protein
MNPSWMRRTLHQERMVMESPKRCQIANAAAVRESQL